MKSNGQLTSFVALLLALSACSGGGGTSAPGAAAPDAPDDSRPAVPALAGPTTPEPAQSAEPDTWPIPVITPPAVVDLADGGSLLNDFPSLQFVDTLATSGLQIGYTVEGQQVRTDTGFIEEQWVYMQNCLGETGVPPLIVLLEGSVNPLTPDDDVLRFIDGSGIATASLSLSGTVIQLSVGDFDGSFGAPGFNLRQILGRSLWLAAALPERHYPTRCARVIALDQIPG